MRDDESKNPEAGGGPSRRRVIQGLIGLPLAGSALASAAPEEQEAQGAEPSARSRGPRGRAVVVGAGAFGGWSALMLRRSGWDVTLVDAWGPGNSRASSGGDTRVIRGMYGPDRIYTEWAAQAFTIWKESAREWDRDLYHPTGALWMFQGDDGYAKSSMPFLEDAGFEVERMTPEEAARRWLHVSLEGIRSVYFEHEAGYLTARDACRAVAEALVREGGELVRGTAERPRESAAGLSRLHLAGGGHVEGDQFVFACGPWLGGLFPEVVGKGIVPTRQEVFYLGPPPEPGPWTEDATPTWIDFGERVFYGVPGNLHRGFKVADDTHGEVVDPTEMERRPSRDWLERARGVLERRFPGMAGAPLLESRVCQYENSPDGHYVIDRHPELENVWIVGGGSGHGYKLGPAVGRHVAALVEGGEEPMERFSLARLAGAGDGKTKSQLSGKQGDEG